MRLKEIEERLAQIKAELTTRAAELKEEEITALEKEVTALQEERAAITAAAEKRSALLARIAAGENVDDGNGGEGQQRVLRNFKGAAGESDNDNKYGSMEYRKAFMKYVCRGEALPKEYRADAVSKSTDRRIDDQARICQFRRIKRLCTDTLAILNKHTVTAVLASAHNKISCNSVFSVCRFSDNDSSSRIGIA